MWELAWPIVRLILIERGLHAIVEGIEGAIGKKPPMQTSPSEPSAHFRPDADDDLQPLIDEQELDRVLARPRRRQHFSCYSCD